MDPLWGNCRNLETYLVMTQIWGDAWNHSAIVQCRRCCRAAVTSHPRRSRHTYTHTHTHTRSAVVCSVRVRARRVRDTDTTQRTATATYLLVVTNPLYTLTVSIYNLSVALFSFFSFCFLLCVFFVIDANFTFLHGFLQILSFLACE